MHNIVFIYNCISRFQLVNHGVDEQVVNEMKDSTVKFFSLPLESKRTVEIQDNGFEGFGHHYRRASGKLDWAESVILLTQPIQERNPEMWPTNPSSFRFCFPCQLILHTYILHK